MIRGRSSFSTSGTLKLKPFQILHESYVLLKILHCRNLMTPDRKAHDRFNQLRLRVLDIERRLGINTRYKCSCKCLKKGYNIITDHTVNSCQSKM